MPAGRPATASSRRLASGTLLTFGLIAFAGCTQDESIVVEQVPKDAAAEAMPVEPRRPVEKTDRMLAAIVPRGDEAIFFRITGPKDAVQEEKDEVLQLVASVTFDDGQPDWKLPEGWSEQPGSGERIATLTTSQDLEVSVTRLPIREGEDLKEYRLANVNRWRGQMGLRPIPADKLHAGGDLDDESVAIELSDGTEVTLVNLVGRLQGGMMPPFAGGGSVPPVTSRSSSPAKGDSLTYDVPNGWKSLGADGISRASFVAGDSKLTVTPLPASNTLFDNVNRWRGQVGLPAIDESQLDETVESIRLGDGKDGDYVLLVGPEEPRQAILGVFTVRGDTAWFVKMIGDAETVLREKPNFEAFVKSLRFGT